MRIKGAFHTLPQFCFKKTSGVIPGVIADEGATCLVFLDVDTKFMNGWKRFVELFFRLRVRFAYGGKLKELLPESVVLERTQRHDSQANPAITCHSNA